MKTYHLTSPLMHSPQVADIQRALNAKGYGPLLTDGEYGPATAGVVKKAKYALGYPVSRVNTSAGPFFYGLITGKKPPVAFRVRAKARKRRIAASRTLGEFAFALLEGRIGTKENPPNSNRCWASVWYGMIGPWCAMAVTWAYATAGSKAFLRGRRWAYVPTMLGDALAARYGLSITHDPRKGDPVLFDWEGNGVPDHVGLFEKWIDRQAGKFQTIEGNTGVDNFSNGGEVLRCERYISNVRAFVRVAM